MTELTEIRATLRKAREYSTLANAYRRQAGELLRVARAHREGNADAWPMFLQTLRLSEDTVDSLCRLAPP